MELAWGDHWSIDACPASTIRCRLHSICIIRLQAFICVHVFPQGGSVSVLTYKDVTGSTPAQLAIEKGHRYLGLHLAGKFGDALELLLGASQ